MVRCFLTTFDNPYSPYRVYTTKSNEAAAATGAHTHTVTIGNTGSGNAFGIMNPYLGRYIWRRVS